MSIGNWIAFWITVAVFVGLLVNEVRYELAFCERSDDSS